MPCSIFMYDKNYNNTFSPYLIVIILTITNNTLIRHVKQMSVRETVAQCIYTEAMFPLCSPAAQSEKPLE